MIASGLRAAGSRGLLVDQTVRDIDPATARVLDEIGVPHAMTGLRDTVDAVGGAIRWSAWLRRARTASPVVDELELDDSSAQWSETRSLELLAENGVPVVPWRVAGTREEAVAAARELGYPVVLKVVSPEILHKSDIGGVALDLRTDDAVGEAFDRVTAAGAGVDGARIDGALVAPMRRGGLELIVGAVRDAHWGLTLAVGLGGVWVHVADDTSLRLLPVDEADVRDMLDELRGRALLDGVRGQPAADVDRLVETITAVRASRGAPWPAPRLDRDQSAARRRCDDRGTRRRGRLVVTPTPMSRRDRACAGRVRAPPESRRSRAPPICGAEQEVAERHLVVALVHQREVDVDDLLAVGLHARAVVDDALRRPVQCRRGGRSPSRAAGCRSARPSSSIPLRARSPERLHARVHLRRQLLEARRCRRRAMPGCRRTSTPRHGRLAAVQRRVEQVHDLGAAADAPTSAGRRRSPCSSSSGRASRRDTPARRRRRPGTSRPRRRSARCRAAR